MTDKITTEEALAYFRHRLESGQCGKETKQRQAFDVAIEALEYKKSEEEADDKLIVKRCPNCHFWVGIEEDNCPHCGETIDWS